LSTTISEPCITAITDNVGRTVKYDYDGNGRLWKVTDQNNEVEAYTYDANGRLYEVFDKRANRLATEASQPPCTAPTASCYPMVRNEYYPDGRVMRQTLADGAVWQFAYETLADGTRKTTITDPRTFVTERYFNADNYVIREVRAVGQSVEQTFNFERDPVRQLLESVTDALNRTTKFGYDPWGRLTSVTRLHGTPSATTTSYAYDAGGSLASVTDPLNHTTRFSYDDLGSLTSITDPLSHVTSVTSNLQGLPTAITNALGKKTTFGYAQSDLATITDPLGRTTSVFTDGVGRVMSFVNALGKRSMYEYDGRNRVKKVTDPLFGATVIDYDANGNPWHVTDPRNLAPHTYVFDRRNRLQTYTDPLNRTETYLREDFLNLTKHTDRKGQDTLYAYDALNRLQTITYDDGSTVSVKWDAGNRPYEVADSANGTIRLEFDDHDRLTRETTSEGAVQYTYDAAGRPATMSIVGGPQNTYTFDDADRLTTITRAGATISKTYDDANRQTSLAYPNGVTTTYGYNDADELTSISYTNSGASMGAITHTYDAAGRRLTRNSTINGSASTPAVASTSHDAANRLTQWGAQPVAYDNNGNMTSDGTSTFVWNARDQLVSVTNSAGTIGFTYDAFGRRRSRSHNGATSTYFLYDGQNVVREIFNGSPSDLWTGPGLDETYRYSAGINGTYYLLKDALNSTVLESNAEGGGPFIGYSYDAYGNTTAQLPFIFFGGGTTSQYTGRENDSISGLYYMRARYYNPKFGRFVSSDPIGLAGGLNTYAYVGNDPINWTDRMGLSADNDWMDLPKVHPGDLPQVPEGVANAITGFGDAFLVSELLRDALDIDGGVNKCSAAYKRGEIAGTVTGLLPFGLQGAARLSATQIGYTMRLGRNPYVRIGYGWMGKYAGQGQRSLRISSRYLPGDGHLSLESRLPKIPPAGLLNQCECE
jgi:RHS repeat-associated protein